MLGGGGGEGGKGDVRRIPDTCVSNPCTKVNDTCQNPRIWLIFTTFGGPRRPGGRGQRKFGGLWTTTDQPRYLRCVERPGIVGVTGNLSGVPAGQSGTRNGRVGGFCGFPSINIARVVPHGREVSTRCDSCQRSKGAGLIPRREGWMSTGTLAVRSSADRRKTCTIFASGVLHGHRQQEWSTGL